MINSRRREKRIAARLTVRLWGMDANEKPFFQTASTLDITRTGARIAAPQCQLQQGAVIGIQHGNEKARFRVAWIGRPGTSRAGQIGVVCLEPDKYIWERPLSELETAANPEQPRAPLGSSFAAPLPPPAAEPHPTTTTKSSERRDSTRYACTGRAEFKNIEGGFKNWGTVSDLSDTGCYIDTMFPLPSKTLLDAQIQVRNVDIRSRALVRSSHPNVGMGVEFVQTSPEDIQRIQTLISTLSIAPGAAQHAAVSATSQLPAPAANPQRPTAPVSPTSEQTSASDQIYKAIAELRDAEAVLESDALLIELRALAEFVRAIDHARQTAIATHEWLQNSGGVDNFKLLAARDAARVRAVTALARELAVDLDGRNLDPGSDGFEGLANAINQLHARLSVLIGNRHDEPANPISPK